MKLIARAVTRGLSNDPAVHEKCDLVLVCPAKDQKLFRGNMVYDILDWDGVLAIKELGPSCVHRITPDNWGNYTVDDMIGACGRALYFTEKEFNQFAKDNLEKLEEAINSCRG